MNKYSAKGYITFYYTKDGLKYDIDEKEEVLEPFQGEDFFHWFEKNTGHLMDGKEFYDCVDSGVLIDYDGTLGDVYVDGYIRFLYKGIIINHNKKPSQPTLKRRFFKKKAAFFSWPGLGKEWC